MKKRTLFERMFWTPNYFTIAIRNRDAQEAPIWERKHFQSDYVMPAARDYWVADPMLAENNGKTYLFYEAAHHDKGRIEVVELYDNGTVSQPAIALEREYHLSYPFVFKHGDEWYMILCDSRGSAIKGNALPDRLGIYNYSAERKCC